MFFRCFFPQKLTNQCFFRCRFFQKLTFQCFFRCRFFQKLTFRCFFRCRFFQKLTFRCFFRFRLFQKLTFQLFFDFSTSENMTIFSTLFCKTPNNRPFDDFFFDVFLVTPPLSQKLLKSACHIAPPPVTDMNCAFTAGQCKV